MRFTVTPPRQGATTQSDSAHCVNIKSTASRVAFRSVTVTARRLYTRHWSRDNPHRATCFTNDPTVLYIIQTDVILLVVNVLIIDPTDGKLIDLWISDRSPDVALTLTNVRSRRIDPIAESTSNVTKTMNVGDPANVGGKYSTSIGILRDVDYTQ
jgi:hypothetical protein